MLHSVFILTQLSSAVKYYMVAISFLSFYNIVIFRAHIYLDIISVVIPCALHGHDINHILL